EAIAFSGRPTLEDALNQMPQVVPDFNRTANNPGDGTARINLRGFGAGRTLVLLNGRRIAPSGVGGAIDINNLPQALVDRVEIITGGATTVYGSDAVAGVVNFITRDDFAGLEIDASVNTTEENDANAYDVNVAFGNDFGNGRGNVTLYAGTHDREALFASERELTRQSFQNDDTDGTLLEGGNVVTPEGVIFFPEVNLGTNSPWVTFNADGTPRGFVEPDDRYNFQSVNYLQTPLTRYHGGALATFELGSSHELYLETSYSSNEAQQVLAPVPAAGFVNVNIDNLLLTAETRQLFIDNYEIEPGLAEFFVGRRLSDIGPRIIDSERDYWRSVVGLRGDIGNNWDIDAWVTYTRSSETQFLRNDGSASRFQQGLLVDPLTGECFDTSNDCVPIDIFGPGRLSVAAADFLRVTNVQNDTERTQILASLVVSGTPLETRGGPLDTALGIEWRSDDASFEADDVLFTGDTLAYRGEASVDGRESVAEVYAEALVPLAQDKAWAQYFALELGGRYSRYDKAGGVWTYKMGSQWQLSDKLRFRGMHQKSVRAPNNLELFQQPFAESFLLEELNIEDPCSASNDPVGAGVADKCVLQGVPADQVGIFEAGPVPVDFVQGGNPQLAPEEAKTWTLGVVLTPERFFNWQVAIDWFKLEVTDSIGSIDALAICFDPLNAGNLFCENIRRNTTSGNISEVSQLQSNRGLIGTEGIDTLVNYETGLPAAFSVFEGDARVSIDLTWTHTFKNRWQLNPVTRIVDCVGYFGDFCGLGVTGDFGFTLPENRVTTHVNYVSGPLNVHLTSRWIDGTSNSRALEAVFFGSPQPVLAIPAIGSKHYLDLGFGYSFGESITFRAVINNLGDTSPPNMADAVTANNTDSFLYDVFGRSFHLALSARLFR
ncbi:MAG TPA: TonB-dependent receptor, partial [Woeseiaceae bacterium]|nr:TonB-dependent receptor [Woeseiaceae bacterium]